MCLINIIKEIVEMAGVTPASAEYSGLHKYTYEKGVVII
jgi:hypothetical protein